MNVRTVAVIGGGPGGLYVARLLRLRLPRVEVTVYEQDAAGATFGFGIGLASNTQRNLDQADPASMLAIASAGHTLDGMSMRLGQRTIDIIDGGSRGIARAGLLEVLSSAAEDAGVRIVRGGRVSVDELDADLIIAADGVSSATRSARQEQFGAEVGVGRGLYLWCGTDFALERSLFATVSTEFGAFTTHAYPYAADASTFLIETDEETWQRSGLADAAAETAPGETDATSLQFLQQIFADELGGRPLLGNRTQWARFRTVRCERWSSDNIVLLGDAAHTAHYSIGSGTKLAMEDGIALVDALELEPDLATALATYDRVRRPAVESLQNAAMRSQRWWDAFPARASALEPLAVVASFFTRTGRYELSRLRAEFPDLAGEAIADHTGETAGEDADESLSRWVLDHSAGLAGVSTHRVEADGVEPWSKVSTDFIEALARELADAGDDEGTVVCLYGSAERETVLDRFELAEEIKLSWPALTVAVEVLDDDAVAIAAAALIAGRADIVTVRP